MANTEFRTISATATFPKRIIASLGAQLSWTDGSSEKSITSIGTTDSVGETNLMVNSELLPNVGSIVSLRIFSGDSTIIETEAEVIRIERDPAKPKVALHVIKHLAEWKDNVMAAAQNWVSEHVKMNYEEEWAN